MKIKMTVYQQGLLEQVEKLGNEIRALTSLAENKPWLVVDRKKLNLPGSILRPACSGSKKRLKIRRLLKRRRTGALETRTKCRRFGVFLPENMRARLFY